MFKKNASTCLLASLIAVNLQYNQGHLEATPVIVLPIIVDDQSTPVPPPVPRRDVDDVPVIND